MAMYDAFRPSQGELRRWRRRVHFLQVQHPKVRLLQRDMLRALPCLVHWWMYDSASNAVAGMDGSIPRKGLLMLAVAYMAFRWSGG